MIVTFLKFVISIGDGHCYCLPRASKNLAIPLITTTAANTITILTTYIFCSLISSLLQLSFTLSFLMTIFHIQHSYIHSKFGPSHYAFILCFHDKLWHTMSKIYRNTYRELGHKSWKPLATCINVANLRELTLQTKLPHKSNLSNAAHGNVLFLPRLFSAWFLWKICQL